jgi:uncharacterized protein
MISPFLYPICVQTPPPNELGQLAYDGGSPPPVYYLTGEHSISNNADFTSILRSPDGNENTVYAFTHWEDAPGELSFLTLQRDSETGNLTIVDSDRFDWSSWGGLWVPCAGSVTPWNTHLGSEE